MPRGTKAKEQQAPAQSESDPTGAAAPATTTTEPPSTTTSPPASTTTLAPPVATTLSEVEQIVSLLERIDVANAAGISDTMLMEGASRSLQDELSGLALALISPGFSEESFARILRLKHMLGVLDYRNSRHNRFAEEEHVQLIKSAIALHQPPPPTTTTSAPQPVIDPDFDA